MKTEEGQHGSVRVELVETRGALKWGFDKALLSNVEGLNLNGCRFDRLFRNPVFPGGMLAALAAALLLSACLSGPATRPEVAVYDLGAVEPPAREGGLPLTVEVFAPSWLEGRAMQYRLAAEPARRQQFTESRWAAPPAELLAAALRRQLSVQAGAQAGEGCRLRIDLDEWVQVFDDAGQSRMSLSLRAGLRGSRGGELIAQRGFTLDQAAGSNARQGVAAAMALETQLAQGLDEWLRGLGQSHRDLAARCRP